MHGQVKIQNITKTKDREKEEKTVDVPERTLKNNDNATVPMRTGFTGSGSKLHFRMIVYTPTMNLMNKGKNPFL